MWVPNFWGKYIAYHQTSAMPRSGLDLDKQRRAVAQILDNGKCRLIDERVEDEAACAGDRPALQAALQLCRERKAKLIIGKIGRLRRNIDFLAALRDSGIKFVAADLPQANHLNANHFIWEEQRRRALISRHVREALVDAKRRGVVLGRYDGTRDALRLGPAMSAASRRQVADQHARYVMQRIENLRLGRELSLRQIANALDAQFVKAPKGGKWSAAQVRAVLLRYRQMQPER